MTFAALSTEGLQRLKYIYTEQFTFRIGSNDYTIPKLFAAFLSPKVCEMLRNDFNKDSLNIEPFNHKSNCFNLLISLTYGQAIAITDENYDEILYYADKLQNGELVKYCMRFLSSSDASFDSTSLDTVLRSLKAKIQSGTDIDIEIGYLAENFYNINLAEISSFGPEVLNKIFVNKKFTKFDYDKMFEFFMNLSMKHGPKYYILFNNISFRDISHDNFVEFLRFMNRSDLSDEVWNSVKNRIVAPPGNFTKSKNTASFISNVTLPTMSDDEHLTTDLNTISDICQLPAHIDDCQNLPLLLECKESEPLNGVLSYLQKNCFTVKPSSKNTGYATTLVKPQGPKKNFWTQDEENSWIRIDLKRHKLMIKSYSLHGRIDYDQYQLQTWKLQGFNEMKQWEDIDSHENQPLLFKKTVTFHLENKDRKQTKYFMAFKLIQTGVNTSGTNDLVISRIELFGQLAPNKH